MPEPVTIAFVCIAAVSALVAVSSNLPVLIGRAKARIRNISTNQICITRTDSLEMFVPVMIFIEKYMGHKITNKNVVTLKIGGKSKTITQPKPGTYTDFIPGLSIESNTRDGINVEAFTFYYTERTKDQMQVVLRTIDEIKKHL